MANLLTYSGLQTVNVQLNFCFPNILIWSLTAYKSTHYSAAAAVELANDALIERRIAIEYLQQPLPLYLVFLKFFYVLLSEWRVVVLCHWILLFLSSVFDLWPMECHYLLLLYFWRWHFDTLHYSSLPLINQPFARTRHGALFCRIWWRRRCRLSRRTLA